MRRFFRMMRGYTAAIAIGAAFIWAAATIVTTRVKESPPGTITLRMSHWQLETGVKEALDKMSALYHELHPNVVVVQEIIPDATYGMWISTNLIGGTAPDLVEIPQHKVAEDILLSYYNRYFLSITPYINRLNPYNKGNDLANVPLRKTFKDGMQHAYVQELQEYMNVPLSVFGARIFYNRDLYEKLAGTKTPPRDYREFLAVCEKIASQKNAKGQPYIPVAAARDSMWAWNSMMFDTLTYPALRRGDFNRDGIMGSDEMYVAFKTGRIDFQFPAIKARFKMLREVTAYFQTGYMGLTHDDTIFAFAQQRAVFMSTGTWDARSLQKQSEGKFEVGVMDFPLPTRDDPDYGPFVEGPHYEETEGGFPFGITRTSPHPELAMDFLFFLASQQQNQEMNRIMGWIPAINGAKMEPFFDAFAPHLEGVYVGINLNLGGETRNEYIKLSTLYEAGQITYDDFVAKFEPFYKTRGMEDFLEKERDWRRAMVLNEQVLASMRAAAMIDAGSAADSQWVKYRAMTSSRQVMPEIEHAYKMKLVQQGPALQSVGPYEYSHEVLEKIRTRVQPSSGR